ncbi:hypothetical protein YTPLAS72_08230 [Nitrospira sp.]|nr:hypothetical protein YTPLAS72_08230 [Nitrospira sp.]
MKLEGMSKSDRSKGKGLQSISMVFRAQQSACVRNLVNRADLEKIPGYSGTVAGCLLRQVFKDARDTISAHHPTESFPESANRDRSGRLE